MVKNRIKTAIVTISDGCYHQKRKDESGQALKGLLEENGYTILTSRIVPDDISFIQKEILELADREQADLIVATGGTGLGPRDVTPEAIAPLLEKEVPGLAELMRLKGIEETPFAALSRSLVGVRLQTLILGLPGSPRGATQSLTALLEVLPHAIDLIQGRTAH